MADPLDIALGAVVRCERKRLGLTQTALGERVGLRAATARAYICQIETGVAGSPTLRTVRKIAAGLGMRASELLAMAEGYAAVQARPEQDGAAALDEGAPPAPEPEHAMRLVPRFPAARDRALDSYDHLGVSPEALFHGS